jgi:hypothetical protein
MPANKGADSKQGLIITLVIFVLLAIILAVTTFYGFDGQNALLKEKQDAVSAKDSITKERDKEKFQKALAKEVLGVANKEDKDTLSGLIGQYKEAPEFKNIVEDPKLKGLRWDNAQNKPTESMAERDARLTTQVNNLNQQLEKEKASHKRAKDDFDAQLAAANAQMEKMRQDYNKLNAEYVAYQQKRSQEYQGALDGMAEKDKKIEDLTKGMANLTDDKDKEIRRIKGDLATITTTLDKTKEKLPGVQVLDFEQPKGKIVRLARGGVAGGGGSANPRIPFNPARGSPQEQDLTIAYINLGSADNLKPGVTFSVYGTTPDGKTNKVRKGSIEVARVISDHMAAARVMELVDAGREPLMTGDLLYNPAWSPNLREHVAIAGLIDLTGTGRDQTQDLIRELTKQGVVVDAYLDFKEMAVKGKMDWNTNYLIVGEMPEFRASERIGEGDARTERKKEVLAKMSEMQAEAKNYGIQVLPLRRFLSLIGYKVPRSAGVSATDQSFQAAPPRKPKEDEKGPEKAPEKAKDKDDKGM